MFDEDDLLPLSGLQHLVFCDRQAALIHLERTWMDNSLTVEGHDLHRLVDGGAGEARSGVLIRRGVTLTSRRLGLSGRADVVEFHRTEQSSGARLVGREGWWAPFPVEYKRGKPKSHRADEIQVCAQALCLEEMFGRPITSGALFYGLTRRRREVVFDHALRDLTERAAEDLHDLFRERRVPLRYREPKCDRCSLLPACLPRTKRQSKSARAYLLDEFDRSTASEPPQS